MIYLDNAATSFPKPEQVYLAMDRFQRQLGGNPGRSGHRLSTGALAMVESTRLALAQLLGAPDASRLILTFNATDALNLALKGLLSKGDHVVTSHLEHNSVARPLAALERAGTITLDRAPNDAQGRIDLDGLRRLLRPETRLVAVTWASNAFGTLQPIEAIGELTRKHGALLLVDGSQVVGSLPVNVGALAIDALAFPGHKGLLGPTGTGALWVGERCEVAPWREGGTGGDSAEPTQPRQLPHRLEAGTPNTVGLAGLGAGLAYLKERTVEQVRRHELALLEQLLEGLTELKGVRCFGPPAAERSSLVSFVVDGFGAQDVAAILDSSFEIAVRAGLHCAPGAHRQLGTAPEGTVRASVGPFTTAAEVSALLTAVRELTAAA